MPNFIYENVAVAPVQDYVLKHKQKYFVESCWYMVPDLLIVAETLNQLPALYATTVRGKQYQLQNLERRSPFWEDLAKDIFWDEIQKYRDTGDTIQFLPTILNLNEFFVRERYNYLIQREFESVESAINVNEVMAKVLNGIPPHYVATCTDKNRVKTNLSKDRLVGINVVRKAINLVLSRKNFNEPLNDGDPTRPIYRNQRERRSFQSKLDRRSKVTGF